MKLPTLFLLTLLCFCGARAQNSELTITVDDLIRDPRLCPTDIVLTKRTQIAFGAGHAVYEVGSRLPVARVDRETVYVRLGEKFGAVPIGDTNLLEMVNTSFSVSRLRQRLIDEANALPNPPDETPSATPEPVGTSAATPAPVTPGEPFSDDFSDANALSRWKRLTEVEGWNVDTMELKSVQDGYLTLQPYSQGWFRDYRGELFFQSIEGDFEIETLVGALNRTGNRHPSSPYSLAGLMLRMPRSITPQTWRPGGEQYFFFGIGVAGDPNVPVYEYRVTSEGQTQSATAEAGGSVATLKMVKVGSKIFMLAKPRGGGEWQAIATYSLQTRGTTKLQLGITVCTDWPTVERSTVEEHNTRALTNGNPDLRAVFDYIRIKRPDVSSDAVSGTLTKEEIVALFGK